jgi:hypothetical protein
LESIVAMAVLSLEINYTLRNAGKLKPAANAAFLGNSGVLQWKKYGCCKSVTLLWCRNRTLDCCVPSGDLPPTHHASDTAAAPRGEPVPPR